jgi:hypothetical protein
MNSHAAAEFLQHYVHDAQVRWTAEDRQAQQDFVNSHLAGGRWLDWSNESSAMELLQASLVHPVSSAHTRYEALLLAGPTVELVDPSDLFAQALANLESGGRLIGISPCLRDNSPESQLFMDLTRLDLWPYHTAEELLEMLTESGAQLEPQDTQFVPISRFKAAALKDELRFKGFRQIFDQLEKQGYDPMEIGWGELRLLAKVP